MNNSLSRYMTFAVCGTAAMAAFGLSQPAATIAAPGASEGSSGTAGAVFAMTNRAQANKVVAFRRTADGVLSQARTYLTGGNGIGVDFDTQGGLTLSADHRFLYACNPGSDDVTVFAVDGARLFPIQKVNAGDQPLSITFSGNLAYVMDGSVAGNGVTGLTVNGNGRLRPIPDSFRALSSPIAVPGDVQFSPDGHSLIVTGKVGSIIDVFAVSSDGRLSDPVQNPSAGPRPFAAAFRDDGRLLVVESGLPDVNESGVSSYNLLPATSTLSVITAAEKNAQTDGCWIVITNDQKYAYTANFVSGTLSSFRLNDDGSVALLNGVAASTGLTSQPTDLAFDTENHYLYNLLRGTGAVSGFRVEADGSLTPLGVFGAGGVLPVADGASGVAAY